MSEPGTASDTPCAECGSPLRCGAARGDESCWCDALPKVQPRVEPGRAPACLCERCLRRRIESEAAGARSPES
jgi:ribosomal protein L34E